MAHENFERISRQIKKEVDMFDLRKANDFKRMLIKYLENMLKSQEKLTAQWERYLPEITHISIYYNQRSSAYHQQRLWSD